MEFNIKWKLAFAVVFVLFKSIILVKTNEINLTFPKKCNYGQYECIMKAINYVLREKYEGFDPLFIGIIDIKKSANSESTIHIKFDNAYIHGLRNAYAYQIQGFVQNIVGEYSVTLKTPSLSVVGDYEISGQLMSLPLMGKGKSNITLVNANYTIDFEGSEYEQDGGMYLKVNNLKLNVKPERMQFQLDNLFNGNKEMENKMNGYFNENWQTIHNELCGSSHLIFAKIYENILNTIFSRSPYKDFFAE